jgi:hypothetical protein
MTIPSRRSHSGRFSCGTVRGSAQVTQATAENQRHTTATLSGNLRMACSS